MAGSSTRRRKADRPFTPHLRTFLNSGTLSNMTLPPNGRPPSEKLVGCRIRVRPERADEAATLFEQGGLRPIYVDHRNISFWFGKASDEELYRLVNSIPSEFFAIQGVAVGASDPFAPKSGNVR
jgi:hypothetical protein